MSKTTDTQIEFYNKLTRKPAVDLTARFLCPNKQQHYTIAVSPDDFDKTTAECHDCGEHGESTLEVRCPCGTKHVILLNKW